MNKEDFNKILHYQVSPKIVNVIWFVFLFCFSCLLFVCNAEAIAIVNDSLKPFLFWSNTSFAVYAYFTVAIIFTILYCLLGNFFWSYIILEVITICWGIANKIVLSNREQFITIAEFKVLGEAAEVEIDLEAFFHPIIVVLVIVGCINGILLWLLTRKMKKVGNLIQNRKKSLLLRFAIMFVLVISFIALHVKPKQISFYNISAYRETGDVVWFCQSLFNNVIEDVSHDKVLDVYADFKEREEICNVISEKRPNVIVIMSEGFWDINNLEGMVVSSENPMEKFFELTEDAVTGQVAVNIYGGGTNISEFEFLTGINSRYLNTSNCYGSLYSRKQESMVSYMEKLGYYTMAFHPYEGEFWDRETGYANMGFDEFYSDIDFINKEMCHGYISDKSLSQEIIDRFEERKAVLPPQPVFSFAVSVQNHVADLRYFDELSGKKGCTGITTDVLSKEINEEISENVEEYYNGLGETFEALEELICYFEAYKEDTVIVFFGDHAPGFVKQLYDAEGMDTEMNLYRTPYMIWTNYENDYESYGDINLSYLSSVLIEYLNLPKPNQYYMNKYMLKYYPIDTRYEQVRVEGLEEKSRLDMMSIMSTICKRFPKEEMALPFWSVNF